MKHLVLRVTERCNLMCEYCYANASPWADMPDMTMDLALRAVAEACPPGGNIKVQFTGGEPLLNIEVIEAVRGFGLRTGRVLHLAVQTNGALLDAAMCRRLREARCGVGVSIDGVGDGNGMRIDSIGQSAFDRAARGIWQLAEAGVRCNLTAVVSRANAARLNEVLDLALGFGNVGAIGFDMLRNLGRGVSPKCAPSEEALKNGLGRLFARYEEMEALGVAPRIREIERARRRRGSDDTRYCHAQSADSAAIDSLGRVYPCSSLAGIERFRLGTLDDGGVSARENAVRKALAPAEGCLSCKRFRACRGGCPAGNAADGSKNPLDCLMHSMFADYAEKHISQGSKEGDPCRNSYASSRRRIDSGT